jgi:hypothetical protein
MNLQFNSRRRRARADPAACRYSPSIK